MTAEVAVPLLRTSERSEFNRCRQAWEWAYVDETKPGTAAPPLRFGTLVHKALQGYYKKGKKRGRHPASTFLEEYHKELKSQVAMGFRDEDGSWTDAATMGEEMLNGYVERYGADPKWQVLATELPFRVPVMHPRTGKIWFKYAGVIDLVVKDLETGFVGLVDHKTTKEDPRKAADHLTLDEQAGAYWRYGRAALYDLGLLRQDRELNGILFNYLVKRLPDQREQNAEGYYLNQPTKAALVRYMLQQSPESFIGLKGREPKHLTVDELIKAIGPKRAGQLGEVSKNQPGPLFFRAPVWRNDAEGDKVHERVLEQMREMQQARRGKLAIYKTPAKFVCGMCGFKDMCELHESDADWKSLRKATMTHWDPYAEHEIYNASTT